MMSLRRSLASLLRDDSGQGLMEYVLTIALVALAATSGMSSLASAVNSALSQIGAVLGSYIT